MSKSTCVSTPPIMRVPTREPHQSSLTILGLRPNIATEFKKINSESYLWSTRTIHKCCRPWTARTPEELWSAYSGLAYQRLHGPFLVPPAASDIPSGSAQTCHNGKKSESRLHLVGPGLTLVEGSPGLSDPCCRLENKPPWPSSIAWMASTTLREFMLVTGGFTSLNLIPFPLLVIGLTDRTWLRSRLKLGFVGQVSLQHCHTFHQLRHGVEGAGQALGSQFGP